MGYSIAIDGPAGAGKSTIARRIARELSFIYVDTGAMYRAMGLYFLRRHIEAGDRQAVLREAQAVDIRIAYRDQEQAVLLSGEDVTGQLRTEEVGNMASAISVYPEIREKLVALQQELARQADVVMDGRDIGTCVLPEATLKIYLTAGSAQRAKRRYLELQAKGQEADIREIEADIIERDARDMNREASPLRKAADAVVIDSSDMGIEEVTAEVIRLYKERRG